MTYVVVAEEKDGPNFTYTIVDTTNGSIVGKAICHYNQRRSFWDYEDTHGRTIKDKSKITMMLDATMSHKAGNSNVTDR